MGDLLPPEAQDRRNLARRILGTFERAGYQLVIPPTFEHADVVARGNEIDSRDLLRFVEPDSGEVAVMRPDITPQVARIVATQMGDIPGPFRLCYEGRVTRRRRGRARRHQQISQAGVECIGLPGAEGDAEVLTLACDALNAAGLAKFRLELNDVSLVRSLIAGVPEAQREAVLGVLGHKDQAALRGLAKAHGLGKPLVSRLESLMDGYGDIQVLRGAARRYRWPEAQQAISRLTELANRLTTRGLGDAIAVDLGEVRGLTYYTGVSFNILADGPGEAIGSGGRYDNLLQRFGRREAATGFAIDLGNLQWTLRQQGIVPEERGPVRFLVSGADDPARHGLVERLRADGFVAATTSSRDLAACLAFAAAWRYDVVLEPAGKSTRAIRVADQAAQTIRQFETTTLETLQRWAQHSEE